MSGHSTTIPGYRYGDPGLPDPSVSMEELEQLKAALLLGDDDLEALREAGEILVPQADEILDVWYGFIGDNDFLIIYLSRDDGPSADYLARVRERFKQWIADTCRAEYDETWLAYQDEIARRHVLTKNQTDGEAARGTPPVIHYRYVNALVYPVYATIRPFLEKGENDPDKVERMHQAWLKAVLLQTTLWARPYTSDGVW